MVPNSLQILSSQKTWIVTLAIILIAFPLLAHFTDQQFLITQFRRFLIIAIAAVSLDLILGYGGMVSFGHAAFVGIGAYTVGILHWYGPELPFNNWLLDPFISWIVASFTAAALALLVGAVSLRTSGVYFIMITLAFAQLVYFLAIALKSIGGDEGLRFRPNREILGLVNLSDGTTFYYVVLAVLGAVLWFLYRVIHSRFGYVIQGCKDNERRMRALGFETFNYRLVAFVIAGALAGLAGGMLATHEAFVSPAIMHWSKSGDLIIMVVLGGIGTLFGPVIGAVVFLWLESFLPDYSEHWMLPFGVALILVVLFAKQGLYGSLKKSPPTSTKEVQPHA